MPEAAPSPATTEALAAQVAALQAALAAERAAHAESRAQVDQLNKECDQLRASHERLRQDLELLRRRIFIAKAERVDSSQLELEFATKLAAYDVLSGQLANGSASATGTSTSPSAAPKGARPKPKGRRDLSQLDIPEERIEIADPVLDQLVSEGKAERIGFEESYKLAWQRGGHRRLVIARVKYRTVTKGGEPAVETTPMPAEAFPRSLAAPSMLARIISEKHLLGMPLYRIEDRDGRAGVPLDRGTMSRWLEDAGATAGATVLAAARLEAMTSAFCLSTDATGVAVQPIPRADGKRQPCRRGHYFVQIADRDHVFFEYAPRETSAVVGEMFKGFKGYVQADAKNVFDVLFRPPDTETAAEDRRFEVGCWVHGRRGLWEAAICTKSEVAREGLYRISRIYDLEKTWRGQPPDDIKRLRNIHTRPHVEGFFAWVAVEYEKVRTVRGPVRSALGYLVRQKDALMRFLDDGRLLLGRVERWRGDRRSRGVAVAGRFRVQHRCLSPRHGSVSSARSSNRTCGFPASGSLLEFTPSPSSG